MAKILIVATTKMREEHICVGAIDLDKGRSIRLLKSNGGHYSYRECSFEVGQVYQLNYQDSNKRSMPHKNEDVLVLSTLSFENQLGKDCLAEYLRTESRSSKHTNLFITSGRMEDLFEGKLQFTNRGKGYIQRSDVPNHSTCFLLNYEADFLLEMDEKGKPFYHIETSSQKKIIIPWLGVHTPDPIIPKGRIVRFSLAHWWAPNLGDPELCYLQLSEYY